MLTRWVWAVAPRVTGGSCCVCPAWSFDTMALNGGAGCWGSATMRVLGHGGPSLCSHRAFRTMSQDTRGLLVGAAASAWARVGGPVVVEPASERRCQCSWDRRQG